MNKEGYESQGKNIHTPAFWSKKIGKSKTFGQNHKNVTGRLVKWVLWVTVQIFHFLACLQEAKKFVVVVAGRVVVQTSFRVQL